MDINALIKTITLELSNNGKLKLDTSILNATEVKAMQDAFGLKETDFVTIEGLKVSDISKPLENSITITAGTVDVLGVTGLSSKLKFIAGSQVDVIIELTTAKGYKFQDSFPTLTLFPFNVISIASSFYVYSTYSVTTYPFSSKNFSKSNIIVEGLNFVTQISLKALQMLEDFLGKEKMPSDSLNAYGVFCASTTNPYPTMTITADLGIPSFTIVNDLAVKELALLLEVTTPNDNGVQDFEVGVQALTKHLEFDIEIASTGDSLMFNGGPRDHYNATLANIATTVLGSSILPPKTDFNKIMPNALAEAFTEIDFNGFTMVFSLKPTKEVNYIHLDIGEKPNSKITIGFFDLEQFNFNAQWFTPKEPSPMALMNVTAGGKLNVLNTVFTDDFDFELSLSKTTKWEIDKIEANYNGTIHISDIIAEIKPGTKVPVALDNLTFSDIMITAEPAGKSFNCSLNAGYATKIMNETFGLNFYLTFNHAQTSSDIELKAGFVLGEASLILDAEISKTSSGTDFQFIAKADEISISDLITGLFSDFDIDLSVLPEIMLTELVFKYNKPKVGDVSMCALFQFDKQYNGKFYFNAVKDPNTGKWEFVLAGGFGKTPPWDLGEKLPLVGKELKGKFELGEVYFVITSKNAKDLTIDALPDLAITPGVSFAFDLVLAGEKKTVSLSVVKFPQKAGEGTGGKGDGTNLTVLPARKSLVPTLVDAGGDGAAVAKKPAGTINIQKQLGPILIESIQITFADKILSCALNASMTIGPMSGSLDGLSFGSSIAEFKPVFDLKGLGFAFSKGGLSIEGAIVEVPKDQLSKDPPVEFQYDGALIVEVEGLGLSALASYAQLESGLPSFFIFIDINATLGGPPIFIIEGLMGGFGFNRGLKLPGFNEVKDFPLLAMGGPPASGSAKDQAMNTLQILEGQKPGGNGDTTAWIVPKVGEYWVAAGIKFSSFEIIEGELLFVVEFGKELEFALLGLAWLSLPQGVAMADTFVFVELQMEAILEPTEGYFSIAASLTSDSFLLTKDCHLTGGFAFDTWFGSNPNAGQFVLTVGGYHPAFKPPSFFPKVARLGFNWKVSTVVLIKGGAYFAITPSCGMAGASLELLFHAGPVKAWFIAMANMLVTWNPFSFIAGISIDIGVSIRLDLLVCHVTITLSLGAALTLWGPPIGGIVKLHVLIVTVTIKFGSDTAKQKNLEALKWKEFQVLLPKKQDDYVKIVANKGLTQKLKRDTVTKQIIYDTDKTQNPITELWVVRAGKFNFSTNSALPLGTTTLASSKTVFKRDLDTADTICIRPMFSEDISSNNSIAIHEGSSDGPIHPTSTWSTSEVRGPLPETLWGKPLKNSKNQFVQGPTKPSTTFLSGELTGMSVQVPNPVAGATFGVIPIADVMEEFIYPWGNPIKDPQSPVPENPLAIKPIRSSDYLPTTNPEILTDIEEIATTSKTNRDALCTVLKKNNVYSNLGENDSMVEMASEASNLFTADPMEQ